MSNISHLALKGHFEQLRSEINPSQESDRDLLLRAAQLLETILPDLKPSKQAECRDLLESISSRIEALPAMQIKPMKKAGRKEESRKQKSKHAGKVIDRECHLGRITICSCHVDYHFVVQAWVGQFYGCRDLEDPSCRFDDRIHSFLAIRIHACKQQDRN